MNVFQSLASHNNIRARRSKVPLQVRRSELSDHRTIVPRASGISRQWSVLLAVIDLHKLGAPVWAVKAHLETEHKPVSIVRRQNLPADGNQQAGADQEDEEGRLYQEAGGVPVLQAQVSCAR